MSKVFTNTFYDQSAETSTSLIRPTPQSTLDDKHLLEPGDKFSFQMIQDKPLPVSCMVRDSGELDVPYLGRVSVAGNGCRQLFAELKFQLEKDYCYHATVIVGLDPVNQLRGQAFVSGAVRTQGVVDILFNWDLTMGEAIIRMGGFTDVAGYEKSKWREPTTSKEMPGRFLSSMSKTCWKKGKIENDPVLEPEIMKLYRDG